MDLIWQGNRVTLPGGGLHLQFIQPPLPFIITIDTTKAGSASDTMVIPVYSDGYDCIVNWGDGNTTPYIGGTLNTIDNISHTYTSSGIKTITISGTFPEIRFSNGTDRLKLLTIQQWGGNVWRTMSGTFNGCANMTGTYTDSPNLSSVINMESMFVGCSKFNSSVSNWNVSTVTNMQATFNGCVLFNQPMFNPSGLQLATNMFYGCTAFNQNLNSFDTSHVTDMTGMFWSCSHFNGDVPFNTTLVTNMNNMFKSCTVFNKSVSSFNTANVTRMDNMFELCPAFNQSLSSFDTTKVTNMIQMFNGCTNFNQSLASFNTPLVTNMSSMFGTCAAFNGNISNFNTSGVTDLGWMFYGCTNFNQSVAHFNTSINTRFDGMFYNCTSFKQSLATFNINAGTNFGSFAQGCNINETGTATNYDATLISWGAQTPQNTKTISFGTSKYTGGGDAETARTHLRLAVVSGGHGWTITDGGTL